jgi:Dyp-type peroxidase family
MEQIAEVFLILFSQKNLRWSESPAGWLGYIGPFPRRLDMEFDTTLALQDQSMVSVAVRLKEKASLEALQARISELKNPARDDIREALDATRLVHFASISAFNAADPDDRKAKPDNVLLLELNVDGDPNDAIDSVVEHAGPLLEPLFAQVERSAWQVDLATLLKDNSFDTHYLPWGSTGLKFFGTPETPVTDMELQVKLEGAARKALEAYDKKEHLRTRPKEALSFVRSKVKKDKELADFLIRPSRRRLRVSEFTGPGTDVGFTKVLLTHAATYTKLMLASLILAMWGLVYYWLEPHAALCVAGHCLDLKSTLTLSVAGYRFERELPWALLVTGAGAVGAVVLLASALMEHGFARLLDSWARFLRWLPYAVILIGVIAAAAASVAAAWALWTVIRICNRHLLAWFPDLAAAPRWVLAGIAGLAVAALVGFAAVKLWQHRKKIAIPIGIAVLVAVGWYLPKILFAFAGGVLSIVVMVAVVGGVMALALRRLEATDWVDDRPPDYKKVQQFAERENPRDFAQNHIIASTPMKGGLLRRLTLSLSLWAVGKLVQYWFRPGFVLKMSTIHYARWVRLPGKSNSLIFLANYDGSWENYLEDFITKAHQGQSAVWSHAKGFPRTKFLLWGGAEDGARFKRWVRRQQLVTQFWYSRFPHLTTDQVRNNALIHDGLMRAYTDSAARAWLDCFGSMPRPDDTIETSEVQSLVFRGFPALDYTITAAVTLPDGHDRRAAWLKHLNDRITLGERPAQTGKGATFVAFSAAGIEALLPVDADHREAIMSSFPIAFRQGMARRERILRDTDASCPAAWEWADVAGVAQDKHGVHALLFLYGHTPKACKDMLHEHVDILGHGAIRYCIDTEPTADTHHERRKAHKSSAFYEHFGFRDGLSQPIIRGTEKSARAVAEADLVGAGEFILGYKGSSNYVAPAISMPAELDDGGNLQTDVSDMGDRFPRFGAAHAPDRRDFGRNGTFLAVRQIKQDITGFNEYLDKQVAVLKHDYGDLRKIVGCPADADWIASKLMGRRRDGSPLIGRDIDRSDNDFNFGTDDPQGLHCPFGAHVRRANPRGALIPGDPGEVPIAKRHRLLRRGRSYERPAREGGVEKGLLFVGLCADIERQFEFLQQTWISSPAFAGLQNEPDPITTSETGCDRVFTIPTQGGPIYLRELKSFVTVRGGGYFFMPSISALRFLANLKPAGSP